MDVNTTAVVNHLHNVISSGITFGKALSETITSFLSLLPVPISPKAVSVLSVVTFALVVYAIWKSSTEVIRYFLLALAVVILLSILGVL